MLFDQRGNAWVEAELVRLRSENPKLKSVEEKVFAPHCSSRLLTLKCCLLDHVADVLCERLSFMDPEPFERSSLLMR